MSYKRAELLPVTDTNRFGGILGFSASRIPTMPVHNFLATDPRAMEVAESGSSAGYDAGPPWVFKGSALYQLHLVKAETARYFIPKEFRLVEAFGYTLGGLFLAHYDDSPVGRFDEVGHVRHSVIGSI